MIEEKQSRRQFTRAFKAEAVALLLGGDKRAVEVAGNLGIRVELLYRWKNEYVNNRAHAFPGTGRLADPDDLPPLIGPHDKLVIEVSVNT